METPAPKIIDVDVQVKTRGAYKTLSGKPKGLVIHYTAGRSKKPIDAINTLKTLASYGCGCLVMDLNGQIYKAANQPLHFTADHAGESKWKELRGISNYCMGMEICCAGLLDDNRKSWFKEQYPIEETNTVIDKDNVKAGIYHKFTMAQEDALFEFCLWQMKTNSEFDPDWVIGHDEIASDRKFDPGGSLSVTMPEYRKYLKEAYNEY